MLFWGITVCSLISAAAIGAASGAFSGLAWLWVLPLGFVGSFIAILLPLFLFLWLASAVVDMDKPQEKDSKFYRKLIEIYAWIIVHFLRVRLRVQGGEQFPGSGRFLLACNHNSDLDPVMLIAAFPGKQMAFISKRENDRKFIVGKVMHKIMCQPINRENDREALKTILNCIRLLKEDTVSIAVFPEGYTNYDALLHPLRSGVFKIAQKAQVPIVVCTLHGTRKVFRNFLHLRPSDVELHLLAVIPPEEQKGVTAVQIGERVYNLMAEDLGPESIAPAEKAENT